jgi:hypothetical protein
MSYVFQEWAIWWTTGEEAKIIGEHFNVGSDLPLPMICPQYMRDEFSSRYGRDGRGRLWVHSSLTDAPQSVAFDDEVGTALQSHCARCAGIVIRRRDVWTLQHLPGIVTYLDLVRLT